MNASDPYGLDSTDFARFVKMDQSSLLLEDGDVPDQPPHPLLDIPHVNSVCKHLRERENALRRLRKPNGEMSDDPYFAFDEGLMVRPEVLVMFCIDYFKAHPEALA